jgi:hypothetical protein
MTTRSDDWSDMVSQLFDETEQDPRVQALLDAAAAPTESGPLPGEQEALAAFREANSRRRFSMRPLSPVRAAVAAGLGAGVLLAAGVGGAAAGVLPGAAQDTAKTWLDTVGVEVPGPNAKSAGHVDERGKSAEAGVPDEDVATETDATETEAEADEPADTTGESTEKELPEASEHGQTVSETARTTDAEGADKGAEISGLASEGKSTEGRAHAGGPDETEPTEDAEPTDTTEDAEPGAQGKAKADEASEGTRAQGGEKRP